MGKGALIRTLRSWALFFACQIVAWPALAADLVNAARDNDQALVSRLVNAGDDVNARGEREATALHWVAFHGNEALARLLVDAGARVDARLSGGSTPLHLAAYKGHTGIVRLLLRRGADRDAKTHDGVTPLDWAERRGHQAAADVLAGRSRTSTQPATGWPAPPASQTATVSEPPPAASVGERGHRVQLFALSSAQRAEAAASRYSERYADVLGDAALVATPLGGTAQPVFRVQSKPVSLLRARAICGELQRRGQTCIVRTIPDTDRP